jgi:type II secretory pathway pseudopilin PulG
VSGTQGRWAWLPRVLAESVLIVLSVLLALAVDQWRDERDRAELAEVALGSIRAELEANRAGVERAREHHLAMHDSLTTYAEAGQRPPARLYLGGIFNPALVHSIAWESARETGATAEIPYETILELSRIYDIQTRYQALGSRLTQDIMTDVRREGTEVVLGDRFRGFISLQEDFAGREGRLLDDYARVAELLTAVR